MLTAAARTAPLPEPVPATNPRDPVLVPSTAAFTTFRLEHRYDDHP